MNAYHIPYILFYFFFLILALLNIGAGKSFGKHRLVLFGATVVFILLAGAKWMENGGIYDYYIYTDAYANPVDLNNIGDYFSSGHTWFMEPGYMVLSSLFYNFISTNPNVFFLFISTVTTIVLISAFNRNDIKNYIFLILFVYVTRLYIQYNFVMIRQALALAIVWWAMPYVLDKKNMKFIFICLLATSLHYSAIMAILMIFINRIRIGRNLAIWSLPISIGLYLLVNFYFESVFSSMASTIHVLQNYSTYIVNDSGSGNFFNYVECLPFLFLAIRNRKELVKERNGLFFFNMMILYVIMLGVFLQMYVTLRLSTYFIFPYFYLLNWINTRRTSEIFNWKINIWLIAYFIFYGIRFLGVYETTSNYPYKMFFFQ